MATSRDIICIGSVLWDIIGRSEAEMKAGYDVPGHITRMPGGVAMIIAMTLGRFDLRPILITAIGTDPEGEELIARAASMGMVTDHVHRANRPTDRYMAVEGKNGLIAAIADAHSLEDAGSDILAPLEDGRLGSESAPWDGAIALDGNLTEELLTEIASSALFARADLRVAPASPGKARRLLPLLTHARATVYLNLIEANLITGTPSETTDRAASVLLGQGARRVVVTDGANPATVASPDGSLTKAPPPVNVRRITGAGDTFLAAHIAAETRGESGEAALEAALEAAARYISTEDVP